MNGKEEFGPIVNKLQYPAKRPETGTQRETEIQAFYESYIHNTTAKKTRAYRHGYGLHFQLHFLACWACSKYSINAKRVPWNSPDWIS